MPEKKEKTTPPSGARKKKNSPAGGKYFEAVGRRKSSVARVRLFEKPTEGKKGDVLINDKAMLTYLPIKELRDTVKAPLKKVEVLKNFFISVKVKGGGISSQAGAIRLGISRALLKFNPEFRLILKPEGFLTRDPRAKERRKFGLKKARKAAQWSKR